MMKKYKLIATKRFRKDFKRCVRRNWNTSELELVIELLQEGKQLPSKYHNHPLSGDRVGQMDCHIKDDWVLIYKIIENELILLLVEMGSHSDLTL